MGGAGDEGDVGIIREDWRPRERKINIRGESEGELGGVYVLLYFLFTSHAHFRHDGWVLLGGH